MKKMIVILALMSLPWATLAQLDSSQTGSEIESVTVEGKDVTISAKGLDIRSVLYDLFSQTGHNFIIDDGVRHVLYLNLAGVEFDKALEVVLKHAGLGFEVKDKIYYIGKNRPKNFGPVKKTTEPVQPPKLPNSPEAREEEGGKTHGETKPAGKITDADLQKARLTTRMAMAPIRDVFKEFTKQTGIVIEVDENVPHYKIDAFLLDTSLKYALDVVVEATGLKFTKTDAKTIKIEKKS